MIIVWLLTWSKLEKGSEGVKKEPSQNDLENYAVSNSCFSQTYQVNNVFLIQTSQRLFSKFV